MVSDVATTAAVVAHGQVGVPADETRAAAVALLGVVCAPALVDNSLVAGEDPVLRWGWDPVPVVGRGTLAEEGEAPPPPPPLPATVTAVLLARTPRRPGPPLVFAHVVSALLDAAAPGRLLALQVAALSLLGRWAPVAAATDAAAVTEVLPGVVSGLVRLLLHDPKVPHRLPTAALGALTAWTHAHLARVPAVGPALDQQAAWDTVTARLRAAALAEAAPPTAASTEGGDTQSALAHVGRALERVVPAAAAGTHPAVRIAAAAAAARLLGGAASVPAATATVLTETLLALAGDPDVDVASHARAALRDALGTSSSSSSARTVPLAALAERLLRTCPAVLVSPARTDADKALAAQRTRVALNMLGAAAARTLVDAAVTDGWLGWLAVLAPPAAPGDAASAGDRGSITGLHALLPASATHTTATWPFPSRQ
jgi:hypothetical protein